MAHETYCYRFEPETNMNQVEEILLLATMAAEGLHGRSRVHLEADFKCDPAESVAEIAAGTDVGDAISRIFTALLTMTIGEAAFSVVQEVEHRG